MQDSKQPLNQQLFDHLGKSSIPLQLREWLAFSGLVAQHIMDYAIPQYGDINDAVAEWTPEDIARQIDKYTRRVGKNMRPGQDLLDMLKVAHYACRAHTKIAAKQQEGKDDATA